jgi:hypothetical protein
LMTSSTIPPTSINRNCSPTSWPENLFSPDKFSVKQMGRQSVLHCR